MAEKLTEEQIAEYKEAFSLFDKSSNGTIAANQLGTVMRLLGLYPGETELSEMISVVDADGLGTIDFPEFLTLMAHKIQDVDTDKDFTEAFKVFDRDGSGLLSAAEIRYYMQTFGKNVTEAEVEEIISALDLGGDGQIPYEQVVELMMAK
jgi:calmodulin